MSSACSLTASPCARSHNPFHHCPVHADKSPKLECSCDSKEQNNFEFHGNVMNIIFGLFWSPLPPLVPLLTLASLTQVRVHERVQGAHEVEAPRDDQQSEGGVWDAAVKNGGSLASAWDLAMFDWTGSTREQRRRLQTPPHRRFATSAAAPRLWPDGFATGHGVRARTALWSCHEGCGE